MRKEIERVLEIAGVRTAEAEPADMQFINHQILDPGRDRPVRIELVPPEFVFGDPARFGPNGAALRIGLVEDFGDPLRVDHH